MSLPLHPLYLWVAGPHVPWRPGRTDHPDGKNCPPDGRLPDGAKGAPHIRDVFYRMGFNDQEIVALSGAHSMGRCAGSKNIFFLRGCYGHKLGALVGTRCASLSTVLPTSMLPTQL